MGHAPVPLTLHNTLTRAKEVFAPLDPSHVRMYVCGPTVYDLPHVGNARAAVVFDVLFRLLQRRYPKVTYVRNITDIDDKIIEASSRTGEPIAALTRRTAEAYHQDVAALGALPPTLEPRATEHIGPMITLIERLIAGGFAYEAEGHVLFSVPAMPDYGRLSGRDRDEQIAGARVEVAPYKRDPADFVLWKPSTPDQPGWDSPWGRGRPGWHIECSAMAEVHLGRIFDIHGGGLDLIFPHHENEIAQSRCAHGTPIMARYWLHNGYLVMSGEKMSKSLGNIVTVRELLQDWQGEAIRFALLGAQYRQPLDMTDTTLAQAKSALDRLYGALRQQTAQVTAETNDDLFSALDDDLNTPLAIARLHDLAGRLNRGEDAARAKADLLALGQVLGLLQQDPEAWFRGTGGALDDQQIDELIARRKQAREKKDYAEADRIRKELAEKGVVLEDTGGRTTWRRG